jgi:hypothetical protein
MMASDLIEGKATENNLLARLAKIEDRLAQLEKNQRQPLTPPTYAATNVSADRAFNADTVAIAELADVVGTMIADLRAQGRFL